MKDFTHFDEAGNAVMVDVSEKKETVRSATASGIIRVSDEVFSAIRDQNVKKGDVLGVARVAGIMAAKKTSELIPMCHPLMINSCTIDFEMKEDDYTIRAIATVKITGKTGVEMEALTATTTALLTIYDMCKAIDKNMILEDIALDEKIGGKSGHYQRI